MLARQRHRSQDLSGRRLPWIFLPLCGVLVLVFFREKSSSDEGSAFLASNPRVDGEAKEGLGRRGMIAAVASANAILPGLSTLLLAPESASAQQAWQLKLPRTWQVFEKNDAPPPEVKSPVALVVAGNADEGGELVVLRVPLSTAKGDPNAAVSQDMINYFTNQKSASAQKAVDALAASQKTQPGLISFNQLGAPKEIAKNNKRYLSYEYESSACQGVVTKGVNGDRCEAPEDGRELPLFEKRHLITMTVSDEGAAAAGQKDPTSYLWILDISGPRGVKDAKSPWGTLAEAVSEISGSFELAGSLERLDELRTIELTPDQVKAVNELGKAGELPSDMR